MFFASDNAGPVHPQVWAAMQAADAGHAMPYGNDPLSAEVTEQIRTLFEAPDASVFLVPTGTAANALILATLAQPWDTVFCTPMAHIQEDECNAPEFYTGGAKLTLVDAQNGKMRPDALARTLSGAGGSVHQAQRGPLSLTNVTELGTLYTLDELRALTEIARSYGIATHLDGARFANAAAALECSPAEMTWKAGIDAVSFGGTKNGLMGVEAAVFFDPDHAHEFALRRKRGAHLFSKHRYLAAQMQGYLQDDLWRQTAAQANALAGKLAQGIAATDGAVLLHPAEANMVFASWPRALHQRLREAGAVYYMMGAQDGPADEMIAARLVCDWSLGAGVDQFLELLNGR